MSQVAYTSQSQDVFDLSHKGVADLFNAMDEILVRNTLNANWKTFGPPDSHLVDCELIRVYPKIRGWFVLEYVFTIDSIKGRHEQTWFAELAGEFASNHCAQLRESLRKTRRRQLSRKRRQQIFSVPSLGLTFRPVGLDERLLGLQLFHRPEQALHTLGPYLGDSNGVAPRVQLLAHRLGRRSVLRCSYDGQDRSLIVKLFKLRSPRGPQVFQWMQSLWVDGFSSGNPFVIPEPIDYLADWNAIVMEELPCGNLDDRAFPQYFFSRAGRLLRLFHQSGLKTTSEYRVADEVALLRRWSKLTGQVYPSLESRLKKILHMLVSELDRMPEILSVVAHRDYYDKQILVYQDQCGLLDFDTVCRSDPALDIGNFLAHMDLRALQSLSVETSAGDDFLEAYSDIDQSMLERIAVFRRCAHLRLACLYAFWPRWRSVCHPLLRLANG